MARLVRLSKGEWSKTQHSVWRFDEDNTVRSHSILLRRNEEYGSLDLKVRGLFNIQRDTPLLVTFQLPPWMVEPHGDTTPPHTIRTTPDIDMLMSVHEWHTEPKLCIMFGPEEVAKYHYLCRSPFTIGRRSFLGAGVTEEQHLATINEIMTRGRLLCSEEVVREFNDPEKLMLMYRFSMEAEKARQSLDLNVDVHPRIVEQVVPTADNNVVVTDPIPVPTQLNLNEATSPISVLHNTYETSPYGGVRVGYGGYDVARDREMRHGYYESLMASTYAVELQRIYGVPGSEFTGYQPTNLNIQQSGDQEIPQYQLPLEVSPTASSTEINTSGTVIAQINNSTLGTGYMHSEGISDVGESSTRVKGDDDLYVEGPGTTDVAGKGGHIDAADLVDGKRAVEQGGK
uniref:Uncharacterized protein n=1 Tax=Brassica campestris TaxID=3711 RepID=M4CDT3_BRACM